MKWFFNREGMASWSSSVMSKCDINLKLKLDVSHGDTTCDVVICGRWMDIR